MRATDAHAPRGSRGHPRLGWGGLAPRPHRSPAGKPVSCESFQDKDKQQDRGRSLHRVQEGLLLPSPGGDKMAHADLRVTFPKQDRRQGFPGGSMGENPPASSGTRVLSLIREDPACSGACAPQPEQPLQREARLALPESSPRAHSQRKAHTVTRGSQK